MPPKRKNGRGKCKGSTKGYVLGKKQTEKEARDQQLSFYDPKCKYHMKERTLNIDPMCTYSLQMTWKIRKVYISPPTGENLPKIRENPAKNWPKNCEIMVR